MSSPTIVGHDAAFPIDQLQPYRDNPRRGDVGAIAESLEAHGQYRPIVANRGTSASVQGEVLAGNHTLAAARHLGWDTVAVTWVDVDDDTAARIVLVDNRVNDLADYQHAELAELLAELAGTDLGLIGTGYSGDDLDDLLHLLGPPPVERIAADAGPHRPEVFWPELRIRMPPELHARWTELPGDNDLERLQALLP